MNTVEQVLDNWTKLAAFMLRAGSVQAATTQIVNAGAVMVNRGVHQANSTSVLSLFATLPYSASHVDEAADGIVLASSTSSSFERQQYYTRRLAGVVDCHAQSGEGRVADPQDVSVS